MNLNQQTPTEPEGKRARFRRGLLKEGKTFLFRFIWLSGGAMVFGVIRMLIDRRNEEGELEHWVNFLDILKNFFN